MTESFPDNCAINTEEFDIPLSAPRVHHTPHSFRLFEPLSIGEFVIHLWCSAKPRNVPVQEKRTKTRVMVSSYLPQGTGGVRIPNFKSTLSYDNSQATSSGNTGTGTNVKPYPFLRSRSEPVHVLRPPQHLFSGEPDSPQLLSCDPSDYVSPFTSYHVRSYSAPAISELQPSQLYKILPSFINDAPENFVWGIIIYKDGDKVNPNEDSAFAGFSWSKCDRDGCPWEDRHFTKIEISEILLDIYSTFEEKHQKVQLDCSLPTPAPGIPKHILSERNIFLDLARSVSSSSSPGTNVDQLLCSEVASFHLNNHEEIQSRLPTTVSASAITSYDGDDADSIKGVTPPYTFNTQPLPENIGFEFEPVSYSTESSFSAGNFEGLNVSQYSYLEPEWKTNNTIPNWKYDLKQSLTAF